MSKKIILPAIATVGLIFGFSDMTFDSCENVSELCIANVEALSYNDEYNDPRVSFGYKLTDCYEIVTFRGVEYEELVGASCQPSNPEATCNQRQAWGKCK